ncbi:glutamate synthase central domain-containing protein, partial [Silvibacterium sp.]|uniref:glutamate synthase central domain-containing protein n=1 Tax=Silvibacterium sp. TaxID=1964179 RepID=UPI0039E6CEA7
MGSINKTDFVSVFERPQSSSSSSSVSAPAASLINSRFEHESCGVGFVATLTNIPSHDILEKALTALARLEHRGAIAADGKSGDGIGISTGIPRELLLASVGKTLAEDRPLAVGVIFFPQQDEASLAASQAAFEASLATQNLQLLAWREVPIRREVLGEIALSTLPIIRHALITDATDAEFKTRAFARRLYLSRKHFERSENALIAANPQHQLSYVCSLSTSNMVYKAMCIGRLLADFYPDLTNPEFATAYALFHQRYATNVAPSWDRAQPLRMMAHNGEINTVWGNRARMRARAAVFNAEHDGALEPLFTPDGSDSTSLDEVVEMLSRNGRTVAEALRMLIQPAALEKPSAFFSYAADSAEPWDGPAAIAFSDGPLVGAILDRNGLRPCRFFVTQDQLVVLGSEAGLVDLDPETIVHSGRLGPGQMLVVDLKDKKLYEDEELQTIFDGAAPEYESLLEEHILEDHVPDTPIEIADLTRLHVAFGYSREDVNMILKPMATDGKDAVWSMGDDTPIAPLARAPRPLYSYFRQRFAQVTNPPIDSLREARVVQLHTRLGPWPHMLDKRRPLPGLSLRSPILSLAQMHDLRAREHALANNLPLAVLECILPAGQTLAATLDELCAKAIDLVRGGAAILLLTDHVADLTSPAIPMALVLGAVHQALIASGDRTRAGLAVEAGDCRDVHHVAVLLGMGAGAVCPWLALETARSLNPEKGESNTLHAIDAGLAKIMSKMGISVVDSYRSAHLFDSLGLAKDVVARCFTGVEAPLGGIGYAEIEAQIRQAWQNGQSTITGDGEGGAPVPTATATKDLPDYGWIRFRKADVSEPHSWQPQTVKALQTVVGSARGIAAVAEPAAAWQAFSTQAVEPQPANIRDLLEIRPAGAPLPVEQVETPASMYKRFIASAMSLGSLSPEAHQTVTAAMNMIGAKSNTGEGGEDPAVYQPNVDLDLLGRPTPSSLLNNKIKQVASGRFGVTTEYLMHAEEIEIKVAQGAKPGEGGQLP